MDEPKDTEQCPECLSRNLRFGGSRDIYPPVRKGQPEPAERRAVAKVITVRCGRCRATWTITRRIT